MKRMFSALLASAGLIGLAIPGAVQAHDLRGIVAEQGAVEPEAWTKIEETRALRRLLASQSGRSSDGELEAVIIATAAWPDNRISVCFLEVGTQGRNHVAEVAQRWMEATGLQLDFGPPGSPRTCNSASPSNIRVSFTGAGHWSLLGTEAKRVGSGSPTLNLGGMNKASFTELEDGIILHEFGHAIGFDHEHQSPASVCESEFNWDFLYAEMGSWGWSRHKIDVNMRQIPPSTKLTTISTFDLESVMLYSLKREFFRSDVVNPACFIPKANNTISRLDREAVATVYPIVVSAPQPSMRAFPSARPRDEAVTKAIGRLKELSSGQ
jgi:hypothetical protein